VAHSADAPSIAPVSPALAGLVPAERLADCRVVEIVPEGDYVTQGIGAPLRKLRDPAATAHVPVA
jgi:hypothetical protein